MSGEIVLQNNFQTLVEQSSGKKVIVWNKNDDYLKKTVVGAREVVSSKQVLMQSDPARGVVGLVEGLLAVNRVAFEDLQKAWAERSQDPNSQAGPVPSLKQMAMAAAQKLATLWEQGHPSKDKTGVYRVMLAYGGGFAWEKRTAHFGHDPRVLDASDLPGWPKNLNGVRFYAVHSSECYPFLDLDIPVWIAPENKNTAVKNAEALRARGTQNSYTWVREFPIATPEKNLIEKADFTLFVHGLPVMWVEMKTEEAGLKEAVKNFQDKQTYKGAPIRLMCDGRRAIITAQSDGAMEKWYVGRNPMGHGHGMPDAGQQGVTVGQHYLVGQILARPERFEFLIRRASCFNGEGEFLVARPQQYQALAYWMRDLLWSRCARQDISDRLVRHTQRTGKTHTMTRAIHLALTDIGHLGSAFDLALLMVGEVNIIKQIATTIKEGNTALLDVSIAIQRAETRQELKKVIEDQYNNPNMKRVVLANTQKMESVNHLKKLGKENQGKLSEKLKELTDHQNEALRPLIVLDESHLSQHGGIADMRNLLFPNAKHLLFTATPKNEMADYYGIHDAHQILDDFGYKQAVDAGLVVPVLFEHVPTIMGANLDKIEKLSAALQSTDPAAVANALDDIEDLSAKACSPLAREVIKQINHDLIADRLTAVVQRLDQIEQSLPKNDKGGPLFVPRGMVFCSSVDQARDIIKWIQKDNKKQAEKQNRTLADHEKNMFGGKRFGMDVSNFGHGDEHTVSELNPGVAEQSNIKDRFEIDNPDTRIDILLVVGKYTKGYDNKELCLVALLRTIRELSLINQITTRPATSRDGKATGVCLDLTFGQGNVQSWRASLALYDKEASDVPLFDEEGVAALRKEVMGHLDQAAQHVNLSWTHEDLGVNKNLGPAIDQLKNCGVQQAGLFIQATNNACEVIQKIPDAHVWKPLKQPLMGVKFILTHVRQIFPELDVATGTEFEQEDTHVVTFKPETLGARVAAALQILGGGTLKDFLDVTQLYAQVMDGAIPESQAVHEARTKAEADNAVEAARAILGMPVSSLSIAHEDSAKDPGTQLRKALLSALEQLQASLHQQSTATGTTNIKTIDAQVAALHVSIQKVMQSLGPQQFQSLLWAQIRQELDRRWVAVGLDGDAAHDVFSPLIDTAASTWASEFEEWRTRLGAQVAAMGATVHTKRWLDHMEQNGSDGSLVRFLPILTRSNSDWKNEFQQYTAEHSDRIHDIRAVMGKNEQSPVTQPMAGFLETVAMEAGRQLELIEACVAWNEARHGAA